MVAMAMAAWTRTEFRSYLCKRVSRNANRCHPSIYLSIHQDRFVAAAENATVVVEVVFGSSQFNEIRAFPMIIMFIMFSHKYICSSAYSKSISIHFLFDEMQSGMWCGAKWQARLVFCTRSRQPEWKLVGTIFTSADAAAAVAAASFSFCFIPLISHRELAAMLCVIASNKYTMFPLLYYYR